MMSGMVSTAAASSGCSNRWAIRSLRSSTAAYFNERTEYLV
jgi:hypothetical protein